MNACFHLGNDGVWYVVCVGFSLQVVGMNAVSKHSNVAGRQENIP